MKKLLFYIMMIIVTTLIMEGILQIFSLISPRVEQLILPSRTEPLSFPDPLLGHRPNRRYPEHDKKGFRNKSVPARVDIVAIGDSQTYGITIPREKAWPQQLEKISNLKVYNMAFGGYGPGHSLILIPEALELKPKIIIETLYAGNDLYDCFNIVYYKSLLKHLRTSDVSVLQRMKEVEDREALDYMTYRLSDRLEGNPPIPVADFSPLPSSNQIKRGLSPSLLQSQPQVNKTPGTIRVFFSENSALYGLLRTAKRAITGELVPPSIRDWEAIKKEALAHPSVYQLFQTKNAKTLFMSRYRSAALDMKDPRIKEGFRIALQAIKESYENVRSSNTKFIMLLIPTAELVFEKAVKREGVFIPEYEMLLTHEKLFWKRVKAYLRVQGIPYIDTLPALQDQLDKGPQPYPIDANGHPNEFGYRAIAELIMNKLNQEELFRE